MALSRKHRREQRRLRKSAQELLEEQRIVLSHAGEILGDAGRHARQLSDDYVAPRIDEVAQQARPYVDRGVRRARKAADQVRLFTAPLVASALAGTVKALDRIESDDAAAASKQLQSFGERRGLLKKKKRGAGSVIAIGVGIAAAATVGYALWQAFRTDDELWIAPEN